MIIVLILGGAFILAAIVWRRAKRWHRWGFGLLGALTLFIGIGIGANAHATPAPPVASPARTPRSAVQSPPVKPPAPVAAKAAPVVVAHPGEWVTVGQLAYRVNAIQYLASLPNATVGAPSANNGLWLVVTVSVANHATQPRTISASMFTLTQGTDTYPVSTSADLYVNPGTAFLLSSVNPGLTLTGNIAFNVPQSATYDLHVASGLFASQTRMIALAP